MLQEAPQSMKALTGLDKEDESWTWTGTRNGDAGQGGSGDNEVSISGDSDSMTPTGGENLFPWDPKQGLDRKKKAC